MPDGRRAGILALAVFAILTIAPLLIAVFHAQFLIGIVTRMVVFALAAVSLDLIVGIGGMMSFGHAAFFGLGAYVVAILAGYGVVSALISIPLAILVAALAALAIGALSLRTAGAYFIMITLAFAQMIFYVFSSIKLYGGSDGLLMRARDTLPGIGLTNDVVYYYVCLAALAAFTYAIVHVVQSRFGMVLRGAAASERRMAAVGFNVFPYRLAAFTIGGAGAGLAGALAANGAKFVSPDMLHWTRSGEMLIAVVIGGLGTIVGPIIGAVALIGIESVLTAATEHWMIFLGAILVGVVLIGRRGLFGLFGGTR